MLLNADVSYVLYQVHASHIQCLVRFLELGALEKKKNLLALITSNSALAWLLHGFCELVEIVPRQGDTVDDVTAIRRRSPWGELTFLLYNRSSSKPVTNITNIRYTLYLLDFRVELGG